MSTLAPSESNKAVARRYFEEVLNSRHVEVIDELLTPDVVGHPEVPGARQDREGAKRLAAMYLVAFPDAHFTLHDWIAEGDRVTVRYSATGTHAGDLMGIPPTDKRVEVTGIIVFRLADGRIAESWLNWDELGLLRQIGVIPISGPDAKRSDGVEQYPIRLESGR